MTHPGALDDPRWSSEVVLADGSTGTIRPISPDDGAAIHDFHGRQSRESIYYRFFSPRPQLSDKDVTHLTTVDGVDRMAFVVERDDAIIGVGRYDRYPGRPLAEVAFFTDDEMAGRGIATLLLEYLAAHAREVGIDRFEANVLPGNRRMVRVFKQAGFDAHSSLSDGVVEVSFDIDATPESRARMAERARAAERRAVARLLEPRAVAVIGAGRDPSSIGHRVLRNLLAVPFQGPVHVVHPEARAVAGVRAHQRIGDVPDEIDLAVVCVPAPDVASVVAECGRARVGAVAVISAGFAERGPEGEALQDEVLTTARRFGVRLLGPNCLGVVNTDPEVQLHATFAEGGTPVGSVGLLSQSGTLGGVIAAEARALGMGLSNAVFVGNKADLSGNDLLQFWEDDARTEVVALALESFGNPRRFGRNVRRVARVKPVFAIRSGRSLERRRAPDVVRQDDAAPIGLDDDTIDALLRQTGVVRVPTVTAMLHAAFVASSQPVPSGRGVVVITDSSGAGSLAADACLDAGLELVEPTPSVARSLEPYVLHGRRTSNPIDLPHDAAPADYEAVLDAVLAQPDVHAAVVVYAPSALVDPAPFVRMLERVDERHPEEAIVASLLTDRERTRSSSVPLFHFPDDAALALGRVARYGVWRAEELAGVVDEVDDPAAVAATVEEILGERDAIDLSPTEVDALLAAGGLTTVSRVVLADRDDLARLSSLPAETVAVKAYHHPIGATTQRSGVDLDCNSIDDVHDAADGIEEALGEAAWPLVVQPMVEPGTNVRVEVRTHPVVGSVLAVGPGGAGGRYVEPPRSVLPMSDLSVEALIGESDLAEVLSDPAREHLGAFVRRISALVDAAPEVARLVCDAVIVRDDGVDVVDAWASLARVPASADPEVRRLPTPTLPVAPSR